MTSPGSCVVAQALKFTTYFHDTMFTCIRVQSTLLRRPQHVLCPLRSSTIRQNHNNHTPDSYSKEVDHTPVNEKIYQVDPDSDVQKPYEAPPSREWSRQTHSNHSPDSYSKALEVDNTPPIDQKVHRVNPESDLVQKPYEPPSGKWSRAGVETDEYRSVEGQKQPYAPKGGENTRYGAGKTLAEDKGPETAKSNEGPDGKSSHGRGR